jgi:hypothetical protein
VDRYPHRLHLALDQLAGPRKDLFENVRKASAAKRCATPTRSATSLPSRSEQAGFITRVDLLMDGGITAALRAGEPTMPS